MNMPGLWNQCQLLQPAASAKTCGSDKQKWRQLCKVFPFIFMCIFWYWKELPQVKIRVNEISFGSSVLHNHTCRIFYRVFMINVSKTGNTKTFSKAQFMVRRTEWIRNISCYFPQISSIRLTLSNYTLHTVMLKGLLGGAYHDLKT